MKIIKGFFMAWGNFCIIPCPWKVWDNSCRGLMLAQLPVIGLLTGLLWYGIAILLQWLELPIMITAVLLTVYPFFVSGFIHLDGFMDCCDAVFSRAPLEKRRQILKDSRVGAFAVIWLCVLFMLFFAGIYSWTEKQFDDIVLLAVIPVISRAIGAACVLTKNKISVSQYENLEKSAVGNFVFIIVFAAATTAAGILIAGINGAVAAIIGAAAGLTAVGTAASNLGGMNGDISGYGITWSECFAVICTAIII